MAGSGEGAGAGAGGAREDPRLAGFLGRALAEVPEEGGVRAAVAEGMRRRWAAPPAEAAAAVLRRAVPEERFRAILFYPEDPAAGGEVGDMALYASFLRNPPRGAPPTHPQAKCQIVALAALYLVHSRVPERARAFVLGGGLRALLAALADSESLQLRGQALETLRLLTREEVFPWHGEDPEGDANPSGGGQREGDAEGHTMRQRMLELAGRGLVGTLLGLYDSPFPGASALALQVLAFFLSFVRRNFCQDGRLQLSQGLLDGLERWSKRPDAAEGESELAAELAKDFGRFGPASGAPGGPVGGAKGPSETGGEGGDDNFLKDIYNRTVVNGASGETIGPAYSDTARREGNEAFKREDWRGAIRSYSKALDAPVAEADLTAEPPRRAVLHCNRAAAYLARAGAALEEGVDDTGQLEGVELTAQNLSEKNFAAALLDCDTALSYEGGNVKARFRKAKALLGLGRAKEAREAGQSALNAAEGGAEREIRQWFGAAFSL